jgi:hypothetical protein
MQATVSLKDARCLSLPMCGESIVSDRRAIGEDGVRPEAGIE